MSLDQQIEACEQRITNLENIKRNLFSQSGDIHPSADINKAERDLSLINRDLDDNYQQIALLKIRRMMGF